MRRIDDDFRRPAGTFGFSMQFLLAINNFECIIAGDLLPIGGYRTLLQGFMCRLSVEKFPFSFIYSTNWPLASLKQLIHPFRLHYLNKHICQRLRYQTRTQPRVQRSAEERGAIRHVQNKTKEFCERILDDCIIYCGNTNQNMRQFHFRRSERTPSTIMDG